MQDLERAINTQSVRRPQPHNTNPQNERRERENSRRPFEKNAIWKKRISNAVISVVFATVKSSEDQGTFKMVLNSTLTVNGLLSFKMATSLNHILPINFNYYSTPTLPIYFNCYSTPTLLIYFNCYSTHTLLINFNYYLTYTLTIYKLLLDPHPNHLHQFYLIFE